MIGWMDGRMNAWMDRWVDGCMNNGVSIFPAALIHLSNAQQTHLGVQGINSGFLLPSLHQGSTAHSVYPVLIPKGQREYGKIAQKADGGHTNVASVTALPLAKRAV